jgi:Arc/MetJ-type ribon-helix-helix transcriptional regulator
MTIDLKPEQQRVIDLAVRSGAYQNASEVLDQAFEIIREQLDLEDWMLGQREQVATHIAVGFAQAERGDLTEGGCGSRDIAATTRRAAEAAGMNALFQLTPQAIEEPKE